MQRAESIEHRACFDLLTRILVLQLSNRGKELIKKPPYHPGVAQQTGESPFGRRGINRRGQGELSL